MLVSEAIVIVEEKVECIEDKEDGIGKGDVCECDAVVDMFVRELLLKP
jgi:hypothetical protein